MACIFPFCYTDYGTDHKTEKEDNEKMEKNSYNGDDSGRMHSAADQKGEKRETWQF